MKYETKEIEKDYEVVSSGAIKTDDKRVSNGAICVDFD